MPQGVATLSIQDCVPLPREASLRLERGELLQFPLAPFRLPAGEDLAYLLDASGSHAGRNVSLDPNRPEQTPGWFRPGAERRLQQILTQFSEDLTDWLRAAFPHYAVAAERDRVSYRPLEEATRRVRPSARNDLLRFDAFVNRPTGGRRILRIFANLHPRRPRVWWTSDPFHVLFARFGEEVVQRLRTPSGWCDRLGKSLVRFFQPHSAAPSEYDRFMLAMQDFMKRNEEFQERCRKRLWTFAPGSAWIAFTDGCSYAELRGRFALEHSFFVSAAGLVTPELAPAALLAARPESAATLRQAA
jgi:hypothetical protein